MGSERVKLAAPIKVLGIQAGRACAAPEVQTVRKVLKHQKRKIKNQEQKIREAWQLQSQFRNSSLNRGS